MMALAKLQDRARRRADTLEALKALKDAPVIDLTNGDNTDGDSTDGDSTDGDSTDGDSTDGDSADDGPPGWKRLAVYPTSLTLGSRITEEATFTFKDGRWMDCGRTLSMRTSVVRDVVRVVVRPSNGDPGQFLLERDKQGGGFTGKYGKDETGRISLDAGEMKVMIWLNWGEVGLVSSVWFPE
jgi:hypothetical protein